MNEVSPNRGKARGKIRMNTALKTRMQPKF